MRMARILLCRFSAVVLVILLVFVCLLVTFCLPSAQCSDGVTFSSVDVWHHKRIDWISMYNTLDHWEPDWLNKKDYKLLFEERRKTIAERCSYIRDHLYDFKVGARNRYLHSKRTHQQSKIAKRFMLGNTKPRIVYCASGKTGTVFIRQILTRINKTVKKIPASTIIKFMSVRNPWHRLVSTYLDKSRVNYFKNEVICPYGVGRASSKRIKFPTFPQYMTCIIEHWHAGYADVHWYPEITRCEICTRHYDFIVKTENLSNELMYVINQTNAPQSVKDAAFKSNHHSVNASRSFQTYWKNIPEDQIAEIQNIYKDEIYLLGYPNSPFVDSPYA